ncbi:universal stress protein [Streptomyces sp. NBC_00046]
METDGRRELVVGIDPAGNQHLALAWAADGACRRRLDLRLVVVVPPSHDRRADEDRPGRKATLRTGADALREGADRVRARHPQLRPVTDLLDGFPAAVIGGLSVSARMVVLGSRHLSRTAEYFSAGSLVVPVTAGALPRGGCGRRGAHHPAAAYLVVGIDGSASSKAALGLAFEDADLRGAALRAVSVWQPPRLRGHAARLRRPRAAAPGALPGDHGSSRVNPVVTDASAREREPGEEPRASGNFGSFRPVPCGRPRRLRPREWPGPEAAPENGPGEALEQ